MTYARPESISRELSATNENKACCRLHSVFFFDACCNNHSFASGNVDSPDVYRPRVTNVGIHSRTQSCLEIAVQKTTRSLYTYEETTLYLISKGLKILPASGGVTWHVLIRLSSLWPLGRAFVEEKQSIAKRADSRRLPHSTAKIWFAPLCNIDVKNIFKSTLDANSKTFARPCELW